MASFKKEPPPKKYAKELEAEGKMISCLAEPKKHHDESALCKEVR
jgi:hypothetical protein